MANIGIPFSNPTGILKPLMVKREYLWHSHTDDTEEVINNMKHAKPHVFVQYKIEIYADRTCTIEPCETVLSQADWFKRKLAGTIEGDWSFNPDHNR